MEICVLKQINLRSIPLGWQHKKDYVATLIQRAISNNFVTKHLDLKTNIFISEHYDETIKFHKTEKTDIC